MLELMFLGTGCGIPTKRRNHSAIWLRYEGDSFLWDCGEGTQRQMIMGKTNLMRLKGIFITHWHADHWAGVIGMMQTMNMENRKDSLHIYAPEAERFVGDILDLDYWGPRFKVTPVKVPFEGSRETVIFKTKDYQISSIPVNHTVPAVAYCFKEHDSWNVDLNKAKKFGLRQGPLIGKLKKHGEIVFKNKKIKLTDVADLRKGVKVVYSGDTKKCKNLLEIAREADILIHDATFTEEKIDRMHTGAKEAGEIAKKAGVKKLVLTHFSRRYLDTKPLETEAKKLFKNTVIAEDFMRFRLKRG